MAKWKSKKTVNVDFHHHKTYTFAFVLTAVISIIFGALLMWAISPRNSPNNMPQSGLGTLEYDYSSGKPVRADSAGAKSLRSFLSTKAAQDCAAINSDMPPSQYQALAANDDFTQVLVGYGCGNTLAHMFAVREAGNWRFISPTNHFEQVYGFPECGYVEKNAISTQIAPVCYRENHTATSYHIRSDS